MIYLASPYSHPDAFVREERYLLAMKAMCRLLEQGEYVYAPIVHCHELAKVADLPRDAGFWRRYNFHMLAKSERIGVLRIDGWDRSVGLAEERDEAARLDIPEVIIEP